MKNIYYLLFVLTLTALSCSDEGAFLEKEKGQEEFIPLSEKLISRSSKTVSVEDNYFLKRINANLQNNPNFVLFEAENISRYGDIAWNYATLDFHSSNIYVLCLPYSANAYIDGQPNRDQDVTYGIAKSLYYDLTRKSISRKFYVDYLYEVGHIASTERLNTRDFEVTVWTDGVGEDEDGYYLTSIATTYISSILMRIVSNNLLLKEH